MSDTQVTTLDDEVSAEKPADTKAKASKKTTAAAVEAGIVGKQRTITIHSGEGTAGREDVQIFVNGFGYNIKRGKPVDVPEEVLEVLRNAVTTQYDGGETVEVPRFAFSVHN